MPKGKKLVLQHLEDVSWKVLEEYPDVIKDLIRKRSGLYALYKGKNLYYVGLASNLMVRVKQHLNDQHHRYWDRFSVYLTIHDEHIKELESLLLRIVSPVGNKQGGKFVSSKNLKPILNQYIRDTDADRRADLVGGYVAIRRRKTKAKHAKGAGALQGLVEKRMVLKAWRDGWEYRATLRKDGTINYNGEIYDTPNSAAKAALGKPCGGWRFWRYRDQAGEWVSLARLKQ